MSSGEIAIFCAGRGQNNAPTQQGVLITIAGANAFVQVARDKDYPAMAIPYQGD
jgi:hypothetical protein